MTNSRSDSLTPKQTAFALAYSQSGNASESYRLAYDAEGMLPATIWKRASELLAHGEVAGRIAALRAAVDDRAVSAVGRTAADVARVAWSIAEDVNQPASARIAALQLEARRFREYADKHEMGGPGGGPIPLAVLAKLAVMSDDDLRAALDKGTEAP